jgi:hypothetical protein
MVMGSVPTVRPRYIAGAAKSIYGQPHILGAKLLGTPRY